ASRTLAGGVIIHPWAKRHRRREADLTERLERLGTGDNAQLTESFLNESDAFALPVAPIYQFLNVREEEALACIGAMKGVRAFNAEGETVYTTESKWQRLKDHLLRVLKDFHASRALVPGMDMEELRGKLPFQLSPKVFRVVVDVLVAEKSIAKEDNLLRLAQHRVQLGGQEKSLMERIRQILNAQPMAPPELKEIEKQLGVGRGKLAEVIRLMERERSIVRVATELYFPSASVEKVKTVLCKSLAEKGEISAAAFRDLLGSSRKYTIALLEYFDREGVTLRIGDVRRLKAPLAREKSVH
ncbi:MAG TPA: SelB C-terminal domain-containing protein, partial [Terriglobales bacterium]|nr:SelB C-terminal domain-containing protein [Terriglobales bacterium]